MLEYNAPIVTREEHQEAMRQAERQYYKVVRENDELRRWLTAVNALPAGLDHEQDDSPDENDN